MATGRRIISINNIIINPNSGKKARDLFNNLEQIKNSKINDINELGDIILNSVNLFRESQNNLEGLIGKLLSVSTDNNSALMKAIEEYIDEKGRKFFSCFRRKK